MEGVPTPSAPPKVERPQRAINKHNREECQALAQKSLGCQVASRDNAHASCSEAITAYKDCVKAQALRKRAEKEGTPG